MIDAGAENDRRDMSLAGGPQAHQKPNGALRNVVLHDRGDDRRIEQRDRLEGVVHREVSAEKQLPGPAAGRMEPRSSRGSLHNGRRRPRADQKCWRRKSRSRPASSSSTSSSGNASTRAKISRDPLHITGAEQPGDDAPRIGIQLQRQACDGHRHDWPRGVSESAADRCTRSGAAIRNCQ